jgi:hypothetical protein
MKNNKEYKIGRKCNTCNIRSGKYKIIIILILGFSVQLRVYQ